MCKPVKRIGELFIVGFPGAEPPPTFLNFIAEEHIGGVILFAESCTSQGLIRRNVDLIRDQYRTGSKPFIAVDQEGGRVCRIKSAPAEFGAAADYAAGGRLEQYVEDYRRSAVFMESVGINLNLAPVADLAINPNNTCLDSRCFGSSPEQVIPFVRKTVEISKKSGLLSCLKHFPGLGNADIDPHLDTAVVPYDEVVWRQRDMVPFAAGLEAGADMVMTTSVRLEGFDDVIATGSERIISNLLRRALAFDGPVITDDLTMKGADPLGNYGERALKALNAGHDLLLFGRDFEAAMRAYDFVYAAIGRGEVDPERLTTALSRVSGIKFKLDKPVFR